MVQARAEVMEEAEEILDLATSALERSCDLLHMATRLLVACRRAQVRREITDLQAANDAPQKRKGSSPFVIPGAPAPRLFVVG